MGIEELKNQIICGDCLPILKSLPDKSVDLVITSPPYNLGNKHHTGSNFKQAYEDGMDEIEYQKQQRVVLVELCRIVKDNGSLLYNHKNRIKEGLQISPYEWLFGNGWNVKQELVWFNGSQNFDKIRFYPMTERIYWLVKDPKTVLQNIINHHDLFEWTSEGTDKEHARSFPIDFPISMLRCFLNAKIILDPYAGSGTTCVAAKMEGRDYIGIEISEKYCAIARERLSHVTTKLL